MNSSPNNEKLELRILSYGTEKCLTLSRDCIFNEHFQSDNRNFSGVKLRIPRNGPKWLSVLGGFTRAGSHLRQSGACPTVSLHAGAQSSNILYYCINNSAAARLDSPLRTEKEIQSSDMCTEGKAAFPETYGAL